MTQLLIGLAIGLSLSAGILYASDIVEKQQQQLEREAQRFERLQQQQHRDQDFIRRNSPGSPC